MSLEQYPNIEQGPGLLDAKARIGSYDTVHSHKLDGPTGQYYLYHDIFYKHGTSEVIVIGLDYPDMTQHKSMRLRYMQQDYEAYEKLYPSDHMMYIYKFRIPPVSDPCHVYVATVCALRNPAAAPAAAADDKDDGESLAANMASVLNLSPSVLVAGEGSNQQPQQPQQPQEHVVHHRLTRRFLNKRYNYWIFTMFKHDYNLLNIFCSYYSHMGFDGFTMYNNVPAPASPQAQHTDINHMYNRYHIKFHTWDFEYWLLFEDGKLVKDPDATHPGFRALPNSMQPAAKGLSLIHGAQALAMNQWLYKYGDLYNYVFFCDLDEYLCLGKGKTTINDWVTTFNYACNIFRMAWSTLPEIETASADGAGAGRGITSTHNYKLFATAKMLTTNAFLPVPERTKFMIRPEHAKCLSIHMPEFYPCDGQACRFEIETARFYHFYNWSGKARRAECTFEDTSLQTFTSKW